MSMHCGKRECAFSPETTACLQRFVFVAGKKSAFFKCYCQITWYLVILWLECYEMLKPLFVVLVLVSLAHTFGGRHIYLAFYGLSCQWMNAGKGRKKEIELQGYFSLGETKKDFTNCTDRTEHTEKDACGFISPAAFCQKPRNTVNTYQYWMCHWWKCEERCNLKMRPFCH